MGLGILVPWEEWRAAKRAKARSDEIDRQIKEEAKTFRRCDVLLMGSWSFTVSGVTRTNFVLCRSQRADDVRPLQANEDLIQRRLLS
jgi:hypothetical protein